MLHTCIKALSAMPCKDPHTAIRRYGSEQAIRVTHVLAPVLKTEAARILVERFWPFYLSQRRIQITMWLKELSPSKALYDWLGDSPTIQFQFERRYRLELEANRTALIRLGRLLRQCPITLLYVNGNAQSTHATILADCILQCCGDPCAHLTL
jgi:uncharacterized protein YeaO (DUF488 family)